MRKFAIVIVITSFILLCFIPVLAILRLNRGGENLLKKIPATVAIGPEDASNWHTIQYRDCEYVVYTGSGQVMPMKFVQEKKK
jgi:hypothetical protein